MPCGRYCAQACLERLRYCARGPPGRSRAAASIGTSTRSVALSISRNSGSPRAKSWVACARSPSSQLLQTIHRLGGGGVGLRQLLLRRRVRHARRTPRRRRAVETREAAEAGDAALDEGLCGSGVLRFARMSARNLRDGACVADVCPSGASRGVRSARFRYTSGSSWSMYQAGLVKGIRARSRQKSLASMTRVQMLALEALRRRELPRRTAPAASARSCFSRATSAAMPAALKSGIWPSNSCRPACDRKERIGPEVVLEEARRELRPRVGGGGGRRRPVRRGAGPLQAASAQHERERRGPGPQWRFHDLVIPRAKLRVSRAAAPAAPPGRRPVSRSTAKLDRAAADLAIFHIRGLIGGQVDAGFQPLAAVRAPHRRRTPPARRGAPPAAGLPDRLESVELVDAVRCPAARCAGAGGRAPGRCVVSSLHGGVANCDAARLSWR